VSLKPTPVKAEVVLVLVSVKVSVVVPFSGMEASVKSLLMVGGRARSAWRKREWG